MGDEVAKAFEQKVIDFLDLLISFPEMGSVEVEDKQIRGFQLTRQTRIFYRIKPDHLIVLSFFTVKQHPKKKPRSWLTKHLVQFLTRLQTFELRIIQKTICKGTGIGPAEKTEIPAYDLKHETQYYDSCTCR